MEYAESDELTFAAGSDEAKPQDYSTWLKGSTDHCLCMLAGDIKGAIADSGFFFGNFGIFSPLFFLVTNKSFLQILNIREFKKFNG